MPKLLFCECFSFDYFSLTMFMQRRKLFSIVSSEVHSNGPCSPEYPAEISGVGNPRKVNLAPSVPPRAWLMVYLTFSSLSAARRHFIAAGCFFRISFIFL